jgi:PHD/YefM family antitoxin component YafN of YafNO toxin-antitoxin module
MNEMNITSAQYVSDITGSENASIKVVIDAETVYVPLSPGNRHYDEIMRQVAAGTLTIADAD